MFTTIVVGVDGTARSEHAARVAANIAQKYGASLILVYAYDPVPRYLGTNLYEEAVARAIAHGEEVLEQTVSHLPRSVRAEQELLEGPPAMAILKVVEARQANLVVIGSRGLGEIAALALGSVGHKLIQQSPVPVLIVKKAEPEGA
ncbi:MAG: universal stress protein [Ardenticatenia bacterium]|nr:universal stress protein [Ardenticatenia bacterium]